jgi:hypothetical protein
LYELSKNLDSIFGKKKTPRTFNRMYQNILEVSDMYIPAYAVNRNEHRNMHLRVHYLLGKITEEQWKSQLIKAEKENEKKEQICLVFQAYRDLGNDILRRMINIKTVAEYESLYKEYVQLCEFITEGMRKVLKLYNSSQSRIEEFLNQLPKINTIQEPIQAPEATGLTMIPANVANIVPANVANIVPANVLNAITSALQLLNL